MPDRVPLCLPASLSFCRLVQWGFLPRPGEGPSKETQQSGWWRYTLESACTDAAGRPLVARTTVSGTRDPGYWETSRFVLEAALCIVLEEDELDKAGMPRGVLTPSVAFGDVFKRRLEKSNVVFEAPKLV